MSKPLKYAGVAGILCLIVGVPLRIFNILKACDLNNLDNAVIFSLHILTLLVWLIFYIIFIRGFKLLAEKYQNTLLKISSYILIIFALVYNTYAIATLLSILPSPLDLYILSIPDNKLYPVIATAILILERVIFGGVSILFGIALLKLKPQFGSLVTAAGVVEIVRGAGLLSSILIIIGMWEFISFYFLASLILFIPFYILASLFLFRAAGKIGTTRLC